MKKQYYIFVDKKKLEISPFKAVKIIGSITQLVRQNISIGRNVVNYTTLQRLLSYDKSYHDENYLIKRCSVETSKREIPANDEPICPIHTDKKECKLYHDDENACEGCAYMYV